MKYKKWSEFLVHCSGIKEVMSKPAYCRDLTKTQVATYEKLLIKENLDESEQEKLEVIIRKKERFEFPELSKAAISYLLKRYSIEKYNKRTAATGQLRSFAAKGNLLEGDAIKFISEIESIDYVRPEDTIHNDYLLGICDAMCDSKVVDVKVSWNCTSFLANRGAKLDSKYWWQMQGYLWLYEKDYGEVKYVLLNTPRHLADRERLRQTERYMSGEIDQDMYEEQMERLDTCYDYDNIPEKRRIITFGVNRSKEAISKIGRRVELAREWLNEFEKLHLTNKNIITLEQDYVNVSTEEDNTEPDSTESS